MKKVKVDYLRSKSGRGVINQFTIEVDKDIYFQSYNYIIAVKRGDGSIELAKHYWDYSVTTVKYLSMFLGHNVTETRRKISEGIYKLTYLN